MTIVRRPSPIGELLSLRQAMDHLFEDKAEQVKPRQIRIAPTTIGRSVTTKGNEPEDAQA